MDELRKQFEQDVKDARNGEPESAIARIVLQTYDIMKAAKEIAYSLNHNATVTDMLNVYDRIMRTVNGE